MKPLSSQARAYLDALRTVDSPDDAIAERVFTGVLERAAAGDAGPTLSSDVGTPTVAGAGVSAKTIALAAALAGALAGALAAVVAEPGGVVPEAIPALQGFGGIAEMIGATPAVEPAPVVPELREPTAPNALAPTEPPASETDDPPAPVRAAKPGRTVRPASPRGADAIAEEVALLAEARAALGTGDARAAIAVLRRHSQRFHNGVLARERDVSWITALCILGDTQAARVRADAFLRLHGKSPHAAKVRASCGGQH